MNIKQTLSVVLISAVTTTVAMFGYDSFIRKQGPLQQGNGKLPASYAGFFDSNNNVPGQPVDFQPASQAAVPAVKEAGDDGAASLHQCFHGHARGLVILEDGVENGIRDLVRDLVRV